MRYFTAGESHGKALTGIIEGIPSGLRLSADDIDSDLKRRQGGYGRGGRMKIESDRAEILSGVRWGRTIGSPISLLIENKDWENWREAMSPDEKHEGSIKPLTRPRPGHADMAGAFKYAEHDIRNILERSSARETAMRVALGGVAKAFLREFGMTVGSFVASVGAEIYKPLKKSLSPEDFLSLYKKAEGSPLRCPDKNASARMMKLIDGAVKKDDSLGGTFVVFALGAPPGLGSHTQWDRRLDGRLAQALMSVQAIKGVEVGMGFRAAEGFGSGVMDSFSAGSAVVPAWAARKTNNAGGIEGGMTNGMPVALRAAMKPIPTLRRPLKSVDITTKKPVEAAYERSDVCAVPAAAVIGEAMAALVLADAFLEKFGGDSMDETRRNYGAYIKSLSEF